MLFGTCRKCLNKCTQNKCQNGFVRIYSSQFNTLDLWTLFSELIHHLVRGTEEALDGNFFLCELIEALDKLAGQDRSGDLKVEVGILSRKNEFKQLF